MAFIVNVELLLLFSQDDDVEGSVFSVLWKSINQYVITMIFTEVITYSVSLEYSGSILLVGVVIGDVYSGSVPQIQ